MEQKKTLWIIAAVGLFLAVIIGTACIIYTPSVQTSPTVTYITQADDKSNSVNSGWISTSEPENSSDENLFIVENQNAISKADETESVFDSKEGTVLDLNVLKDELLADNKNDSVTPQNINITVNVSDTATSTIQTIERKPEPVKEVKKEAPKENKSTPAPVTAPAPVQTTKAVAKTTTQTTVKVEKASSTKVNAPAEQKKNVHFWVQVGAYSNKKTAESARNILDENKIPSDIFTYRDTKDNLFFRVRVGPYTTKSEAEYWRSRILKISEFANAASYIVSTEN